jgi:acyl carrier protein
MQNLDLLPAINKIFTEVLEEDNISVTEETSAKDIDAWDSLNHIQLVVAIEKHFKVKFSSSEIYAWKNVADMCLSIKEKSLAL